MVASGVDFFVGITAADAGLVLGLVFVVAAGEVVLVGDGEVSGFGVGDAVFSVVTDTLGSDVLVSALSGTAVSGDEAGEGLEVSSWATATDKAAAIKTRGRTYFFIWVSFIIAF